MVVQNPFLGKSWLRHWQSAERVPCVPAKRRFPSPRPYPSPSAAEFLCGTPQVASRPDRSLSVSCRRSSPSTAERRSDIPQKTNPTPTPPHRPRHPLTPPPSPVKCQASFPSSSSSSTPTTMIAPLRRKLMDGDWCICTMP